MPAGPPEAAGGAELLERARLARGFMPEEEGLALYAVAKRAAGSGLGPILEVGTYCAKSALYLGAGAIASEGKGGALVFSVDHHRGSEENQAGWPHHDHSLVDQDSGRMDTLPFARRAIAEAGLEDRVVLVVGESATVASAWSTPLSLLFLDGGHGEVVAWTDYRAWSPKVSAGGWMAIHDVFPDPAQGGRPPYEIYREAMAGGSFEEDLGAGCGSLRVLRRR